jgi:hypothetical protein
VQSHDYELIKYKPIREIDYIEEEKKELEPINSHVIKYTKLWANHKI